MLFKVVILKSLVLYFFFIVDDLLINSCFCFWNGIVEGKEVLLFFEKVCVFGSGLLFWVIFVFD